MAAITCKITVRPELSCELCGDPCGASLHPQFVQCLSCKLAEEELLDRLVCEYEAREAAEGWGESPSLPEPEYDLDTTVPVSHTVWEEVAADVRAKGSDLLGGVRRDLLGAVARECAKVGLSVRLVAEEVVELTPQVAS